MTAGHDTKHRKRMARRATLTCFLVLNGFASAGSLIFRLYGISLPSFQIAGGIILLLIGLDMVQARRSGTKEVPGEAVESAAKPDVGIVPLGIPMLAGPGAISNVMVLIGQSRGWWHSAILFIAIAVNRNRFLCGSGRGGAGEAVPERNQHTYPHAHHGNDFDRDRRSVHCRRVAGLRITGCNELRTKRFGPRRAPRKEINTTTPLATIGEFMTHSP